MDNNARDKQDMLSFCQSLGLKTFTLPPGQKFPPPVGFYDIADCETPIDLGKHNAGVATGNGVLVLDFDVNPDKGVDGLKTLAEWDALGLPQSLRVQTPSGGMHVYLRTPHEVASSVKKIDPSVDVRGHHGYVVEAGSRTDVGEYVLLTRPKELATAPDWILELCDKPKDRQDQTPLIELDLPENVLIASEWLLNNAPTATEGNGGDITTYQVAARVRDYGISEPAALDLMLDHWNELKASPPWPPQELEIKIANAYNHAQNAPGAKSPAADFSEKLTEEQLNVIKKSEELYFKRPDYQDPPGIESTRHETGAEVNWIEEVDLQQPDLDEFWLVEGVLPLEGMGVIYGQPGCGKTFACLDLGLSVATDRPWLGLDTEPCQVVYVSSEGGKAAAINRIYGWRQEHSVNNTTQFECAVANFNIVEGAEAFLKTLAGRKVRPGLIIIDTLNQNFGGNDENSSKDMGAFTSSISTIRREFNCFVLIVHHSGKNTANGARGHSGLFGAVDSETEVVSVSSNQKTLRVSKNRHGEHGMKYGFELKVRVLGQSNKGKDVTTCVALPTDAPLESAKQASALQKRSPNQKIGVKLLQKQEGLCSDFPEVARWDLEEWTLRTLQELEQLGTEPLPLKRNFKNTLKNLTKGDAPAVRELDCGSIQPIFPTVGKFGKTSYSS